MPYFHGYLYGLVRNHYRTVMYVIDGVVGVQLKANLRLGFFRYSGGRTSRGNGLGKSPPEERGAAKGTV